MAVNLTKVADNFSRAAMQYDQRARSQQQWMQHGLEIALRYGPPTARVLDIGCGTGSFATLAKRARPQWHVTGVDIAPGMLALAQERCDAVFNAGFEKLPFPDTSFELVFSSLAMQWAEDKATAWREIARVLAPQGVAVVVSFGSENLKELTALTDHFAITMLRMESLEAYHAYATNAGLSLLHQESHNEPEHYGSGRALLESISAIGAGNASDDPAMQERIRKSIGPLIELYNTLHAVPEGVVATWNPIYLAAKKS